MSGRALEWELGLSSPAASRALQRAGPGCARGGGGGAHRAQLARARTSHPPVYYLPLADIAAGALERSEETRSYCEWKGSASYFDVIGGEGRCARAAAWGTSDRRSATSCCARRSRSIRLRWTNAMSRGARAGAEGRLLRRLDHERCGWPVQGRARHAPLVAAPYSRFSMTSLRATTARARRRGRCRRVRARPAGGLRRRRRRGRGRAADRARRRRCRDPRRC